MPAPSLSRVLKLSGASIFALLFGGFWYVASTSGVERSALTTMRMVTVMSAGVTAIVLSLVVAVWSWVGAWRERVHPFGTSDREALGRFIAHVLRFVLAILVAIAAAKVVDLAV